MIVVGGGEAELSSLRSLRVVLPSGEGYWTVVDDEYRVVAAADGFLRDLRFGADRAESTTKLYAGELALFLGWAAGSGRDLQRAARELSRFVLMRATPITRRGRGYGRPRSAGRINHVLAVVREFSKHRVAPGEMDARAPGEMDARVLAALYEERERCPEAAAYDLVLVNLFAEPLGAPMRYSRVAQLFASLSRRAGLARPVTPHMLRHAAGSALTPHGGLDVAQAVLGHASITSTQIYVHASAERQREAVERLARARGRSDRTGASP